MTYSEADCLAESLCWSAGVQGWMRPSLPLPEFLKEYSLAGGTHHSAMVYGNDADAIAAFGRMMGFDVVTIR